MLVLQRDRSASAFSDATRKGGSEETYGSHNHDPKVSQEDELVTDGECEQGAGEGRAERTGKALNVDELEGRQ